jgi:hypothetical protein
MKKAKLLFGLTAAIFLLGLAEVISGFVLCLAFTSGGGGLGIRGGGGLGELTFWELSKHTWIDIHDWVAIVLVALVVIHIVLHWKWIARMTKKFFTQVTESWRRTRLYIPEQVNLKAAPVYSEEKGGEKR